MVQRLPEGIRQDTDEDMGLHTAAVLMPYWPQPELAFEYAEGFLRHGQLHVRLPELLGRPAAVIALQHVGTISGQSGSVAWHIPLPTHRGLASLGHHHAHEGTGFGIAFLKPSQALENRVPILQLALSHPRLKFP